MSIVITIHQLQQDALKARTLYKVSRNEYPFANLNNLATGGFALPCSKDQKLRNRLTSATAPHNIETIQTALFQNPSRSIRKNSQALHMRKSSVHKILNSDLKFHPYKIQIVQKLNVYDKQEFFFLFFFFEKLTNFWYLNYKNISIKDFNRTASLHKTAMRLERYSRFGDLN